MNYIDKQFEEWKEVATAEGERAAFKAGYNTVNNWVDADTKSPDKGVRVLTYSELGVHICHIDQTGAWRIAHETQQMAVPVSHWTYLPTIPKARPQEKAESTVPSAQDFTKDATLPKPKKRTKTKQNESE